LRLIDASPGDYAFEEMDAASRFGSAIATSPDEYYARLDALVLKRRMGKHPRCRSHVFIPNGVETMARGPQAPAPRFLVCGRIAPSKRLEEIVAAFALTLARHAGAELHVFGTVEERHRKYASNLGLNAPGVTARGASFDHAHLREPWRAAVVIGTHQGSPNAVLEAMAAGIPVIANDSGGTRESVLDGETGWLLRERATIDEIAAAMIDAAENGERSAAMGARARQFVRAHHSIEEMARRYLAVLTPAPALAHEKMAAWMPPLESPPTCASPASSR
jgi:glycosyltransferase involved in cell wall biosynthesis